MNFNKTKVKIALFAVAMLGMGTIATASGMAYIADEFPEVSTTWIQLLTTAPTIAQMPTTLLAGFLVTKWSKKKLILTGILCWIVGGLTPFFIHSFPVMMLMRLIFGVGLGLTIPMSTSTVAELFEGKERANMLGLSNSFQMLGGMIYTYGGGWLSTLGWQYCFLAYILGIPVFFIVLFNLPDFGKVPKAVGEGGKKYHLSLEVILLSFTALAFTTFWFGFSTNISMFIANEGLGSSVASGTASALKNLAGFLTGLTFGYFTTKIRYYTMSLAPIWAAIGFAILAFSGNFTVVCIASFILGSGVSLFQPTISLVVSNIVPKDAVTTAVGISTAISSTGMFFSPIVINAIADVVGSTTERTKFMIVVYAYIVLAIGTAVYVTKRFPKEKKTAA